MDLERGAQVPQEYKDAAQYHRVRKRIGRARVESSSEEEGSTTSSKHPRMEEEVQRRETKRERMKRLESQWGTEVGVSGDETDEP